MFLQFYADGSHRLARIKCQLTLRWRTFCRHNGVIQNLYSHFKVTTWVWIHKPLTIVTQLSRAIQTECGGLYMHIFKLSFWSCCQQLVKGISCLSGPGVIFDKGVWRCSPEGSQAVTQQREDPGWHRKPCRPALSGWCATYLRWLVCHLHSVQIIHNFLVVKSTFISK